MDPEPRPVWRWAPWTLAAHAALPVVVYAVFRGWGLDAAAGLVLWGHAVAAAAFAASAPWWWRHTGDVVVLVAMNHVATALGAALLSAAVAR